MSKSPSARAELMAIAIIRRSVSASCRSIESVGSPSAGRKRPALIKFRPISNRSSSFV